MAGKFRTPTREGHQYFAVLVDGFSKMVFTFLMRRKSDFPDIFKNFLNWVQAHFGREHVVAQLVSDGAKTYVYMLQEICRQRGIQQVFSPPYEPNFNGTAERSIGSLEDMTRAMLAHAGTPRFLFGFTIKYATFIINRILTLFANGEWATRLEKWTGLPQPHANSFIRVWGCAAWPLDLTPSRDKLDPKATRHIFLGVDTTYNCYLLGTLPHYKLVRSPNVKFDENCFPCKETPQLSQPPSNLYDPIMEDDYPFGPEELPEAPRQTRPILSDKEPSIDPSPHAGNNVDPPPSPTKSGRAWRPSAQCLRNIANEDNHMAVTTPCTKYTAEISMYVEETAAATTDDNTGTAPIPNSEPQRITPKDHAHAMSLPDAAEWRESEIDEYRSHIKNKTIGPPTHLPPGFKPKPAAWAYKNKRNGRRKSRVVIRGYLLVPGVDYNETHAPVIKVATLRALLATATSRGWTINQADIETAFLAAPMDTEVYITLPPAWGDDPSLNLPNKPANTIHRLLKAIPGIPQGSRLHHQNFVHAMHAAGLKESPHDSCLFKHKQHELYVAVWVDDFIETHDDHLEWLAQEVLTTLRKRFTISEVGPLDDLLSMKINYSRINRTMTLSQKHFIDKLLQKSGMQNCNTVSTPMSTSARLTKEDCPQSPAEQEDMKEEAKWYRSNIASCLYLSLWTRPDITFAVNKLSKYMHNPGPYHISLLKHLLRYLKGTTTIGLKYSFCTQDDHQYCKHEYANGLYGYYDASFADDIDTRRSTMGYIFYYNGAPISWSSKVHPFVTTATNHSELCASAMAAQEARFLGHIFEKIGEKPYPIAVYSDSTGAVAMNNNPVHHKSTKHVEIADFYARELVARNIITTSWISNKEMDADAFTKPLPRQLFLKFTSRFTAPT